MKLKELRLKRLVESEFSEAMETVSALAFTIVMAQGEYFRNEINKKEFEEKVGKTAKQIKTLMETFDVKEN